MPPVIVVTLADAPASSGRHVRSRNGIGSMPARLRPMTTRSTPPTIRRVGHVVGEGAAGEGRGDAEQREHRPEPGDVGDRVAQRPSSARPWRSRRARAATATAVSWPRYAGTSGRTHGDRNETSPANTATRNV